MSERDDAKLALKIKQREKLNEEIAEMQEDMELIEAKKPGDIGIFFEAKELGRGAQVQIGKKWYDADEALEILDNDPGDLATGKQFSFIEKLAKEDIDLDIAIKPNGKLVFKVK